MDLHTLACFSDDADEFKSNKIHDVNKINYAGWTPLMYACASGNKNGVEILLDVSADERIVNSKGQSAFMIAAINGHENILDILSGDMYMENIDHQGWTPLIGALIFGNYNTVRYLVKKGANVNAIAKDSGASPLMLAAAEGEQRLVQILLTHGANPTFISKDGETAADIANAHGFSNLAKLLVGSIYYRSPHRREPPMDLHSLLKSINQETYWPLFQMNHINLEHFVKFSEEDLKDIGIRTLGPRKKMALAIETYNYERLFGCHMD